MVEKNELEPDQYEVRSDGMIRLKPGAYFYPSQVEIRIVNGERKAFLKPYTITTSIESKKENTDNVEAKQ